MRQADVDLLEENGWEIVCFSPFEIEQGESRASGLAAEIVLAYYQENE
jgi:hypothetical protein